MYLDYVYECTNCVFCDNHWNLAQNRYAVHVVSRTGSGPSYATSNMHLGLEWRALFMHYKDVPHKWESGSLFEEGAHTISGKEALMT